MYFVQIARYFVTFKRWATRSLLQNGQTQRTGIHARDGDMAGTAMAHERRHNIRIILRC
jgi:hypothetical protein